MNLSYNREVDIAIRINEIGHGRLCALCADLSGGRTDAVRLQGKVEAGGDFRTEGRTDNNINHVCRCQPQRIVRGIEGGKIGLAVQVLEIRHFVIRCTRCQGNEKGYCRNELEESHGIILDFLFFRLQYKGMELPGPFGFRWFRDRLSYRYTCPMAISRR